MKKREEKFSNYDIFRLRGIIVSLNNIKPRIKQISAAGKVGVASKLVEIALEEIKKGGKKNA